MSADKRPTSMMSPTKIEESLPSPQHDQATAELSQVIDELLNQLSSKFNAVSDELLGKIRDTYRKIVDDMSKRLDNLEAAIQAGRNAEGK